VRRERWTYGALVIGILTVMTLGIIVTSQMSVRATELVRLQTEFVSNVSHELKTPLALIRMFGETLESGIVVDGAKRHEFYGIIRRESERLTHLINNVLDIGRIDRGTKAYDLQPQDLVDVVREALDAYRPLLDRLGFRVETDFFTSPIQVSIDREAIGHALVNLLQNAIKYSDGEHFVGVFVGIRASEACVSVADHGVGIPREHLPKIFDRYYRVPRDASTPSPGSGLGLAIVKHAMDANRGRIDVESVVGQGTVFTLVLPLAAAAADEASQRPEHDPASA
jgi:signal transduction histidine kinase